MRISDWSSDVCSSELGGDHPKQRHSHRDGVNEPVGTLAEALVEPGSERPARQQEMTADEGQSGGDQRVGALEHGAHYEAVPLPPSSLNVPAAAGEKRVTRRGSCANQRSEEHTSELQSLMRISYAVFCLEKKTKQQ